MTEENPWQLVSRSEVYKNKWMELVEDRVVQPDGTPGIYAHLQVARAVGVVVVPEPDKIILVGQYRYPIEKYSWEVVAGAIDEGESPEDAGRREMQEEVGAIGGRIIALGSSFYLTNARSNEKAYLYLAEDVSLVNSNPDASEILQVKIVSDSEAKIMLEQGKITHSMTIVALYRYFNR